MRFCRTGDMSSTSSTTRGWVGCLRILKGAEKERTLNHSDQFILLWGGASHTNPPYTDRRTQHPLPAFVVDTGEYKDRDVSHLPLCRGMPTRGASLPHWQWVGRGLPCGPRWIIPDLARFWRSNTNDSSSKIPSLGRMADALRLLFQPLSFTSMDMRFVAENTPYRTINNFRGDTRRSWIRAEGHDTFSVTYIFVAIVRYRAPSISENSHRLSVENIASGRVFRGPTSNLYYHCADSTLWYVSSQSWASAS